MFIFTQLSTLEVLAPSILKQYVFQKGSASVSSLPNSTAADSSHSQIKNATLQATGAVGWRRDGILYKKNVVYLDVVEQVNLLTSSKGTILKADATGRVVMKTMLSGMPQLKLCVNDVAMTSNNNSGSGAGGKRGEAQSPGRSQVVTPSARKPNQTIALDDVTFHQVQRSLHTSYESMFSFNVMIIFWHLFSFTGELSQIEIKVLLNVTVALANI